MTKNQSSFFRVLLFLAGAGIILLAFFFTTRGRELNSTDAFVWTSIGLMYLVFFLPFFFSAINIGNFSGKIPALSLVWPGIFLYIAASSTVIALLIKRLYIPSVETAIIIQAILLFLFLVDVYLAYFASSHVRNVAAEEKVLLQPVNEIKSKAQVLSLAVNKLPAEYEKPQKTLLRTLEDLRYIYPVNNNAGNDLESRILRSLNVLSELCTGISPGAHTAALEPEAANLQALVNERKLLRN